MPVVSSTRTVASDPTSTALLLAGPAALDYWPGLSRNETDRSSATGRASASGRLGGIARLPVVIGAELPRRTPISIVTDLDVQAEGQPRVTGRLSLTSARGSDPGLLVATQARLELHTSGHLERDVRDELCRAADCFLDNIARAAETHQTAA